MKTYEKYKDSGIEWIGEIPEHWEVKKIKRLSLIKRGASPRPIDNPIYFDEYGEYSWVRIADVSASERYLERTTQTLSDYGASFSVKREPGDFFLSIAGTVGKPIITKIKCCIHDGFVYFPNLEINPEYLFYIFSTGLPYKGLGKLGTQLNLNTETIGNIAIPIPKHINGIVDYLDKKTAEIDQLIAEKEQLVALYHEEKTAIINQAVTKGINPDVKLKDSGIEWLGDIPEHWDAVSLKWVSNIYSGGTPSKNKPEYWTNGTIPWLNSGTVNQWDITEASEYITEEALSNSSAKWIPEKAILMALAGQGKTKGMVAQVQFKCTCNQSMGVIIPNNKIDNRFLLYWLKRNYQNIRNLGGGDKRDGINLEMIGGIPIPFFSVSEQTEIVEHIENESARIDAKIAKAEKYINLLTEYRTALISEVVTGKIKVI